MPYFELCAVDGDAETYLDYFEAADADEAIALSVIRLERRTVVLRHQGSAIARLSREGTLTRVADPSASS